MLQESVPGGGCSRIESSKARVEHALSDIIAYIGTQSGVTINDIWQSVDGVGIEDKKALREALYGDERVESRIRSISGYTRKNIYYLVGEAPKK